MGLLPLNENDTLLMPPLILASGRFSLIHFEAKKKSSAFRRCSSIPVATGNTLGSKMISCTGKPTCSVSILYERLQISIRRSKLSACPFSSNAITITAAPYLLINLAWWINSASPDFKLIELTTPLPCRHCSPASITSHLELSIIMGTLAISGSEAIRFKKVFISWVPSSNPSSILISMI